MFTSSMPNLYSADVASAANFYRDLLGFTQTYQFPAEGSPRHVELRLGNSMLALTSHSAIREAGLAAPSPGHPHELVVWCDDIDAAITGLRSAGVRILVEPYDHVAAHRRAYVADPDDNWLALVQG